MGGRSLVDASNNPLLKSILEGTAALQTDPVTQKPKGKKETGQSVADTRAQLDQNYQAVDSAYDSSVAALNTMASTGRGTSSVYNQSQARAQGDATLAKSDAAIIGQAQTYADAMLANPRFDNSKMGEDPNLDFDEEARLLEAFASQAGVDPEEVASNPRLYEAFGRFLGLSTGTMSNDKYYAYDVNGNNLKDNTNNNYKTWTPWVQPKFVQQVAGVGTKIKDNPVAQKFRGNMNAYVKKEMAEGVSEADAIQAWNQMGNLDTTQSLIGQTGFPREDETVIRASEMAAKTQKTLSAFVRSVHAASVNRSPMAASRFAEKITGNRYDEFKGESINDMINLFIHTHAALEEQSETAAQAYSDIMMLAVMDHALQNVYRYENKKSDPNTQDAPASVENESTEAAIKRYDSTLMSGAADQKQIGGTILNNMGFGKTTAEQQEAMGAMAMDIVFKTFDKNQAKKDQLFRKVEVKTVKSGVPITLIGHTFTKEGLALAQDMKGLFEVVMPKSQRNVRYGTLLTDKTAIEKLIGVRVDDYEYTIPFGDTTVAAKHKQQADNTPVRIHRESQQFWDRVYTEYQNELQREAMSQGTERSTILDDLDGANFFNSKGNGNGQKGSFQSRPGFVYVTDRQGRFYHKESPHLIYEGATEKIYTKNDGRSIEDAAQQMDFSDKVKDQQFINTIEFATTNLDKVFYYTYKYGKNWRLNVDQTVGNYQHNKFARSLIAAGVPATYNLKNKKDVIQIKAGIMKRYGMDMKNPIEAALEYDAAINRWTQLDANQDLKGILREAGKEEGFASVAAILEGVKLKKHMDGNNPTYTSNFFTEIDGKTNGLAHAAAQSGDLVSGSRSLIFGEEDYATWNKYYDEFEKIQNDPEKIRELESKYDLEPGALSVYLDAYNSVNNSLLKDFANIRAGVTESGDLVTFPGMLLEGASEKFKVIMQDAQDNGGLAKFTMALDMFGQSEFGRAFTKKPVMIFAYGAGDARHIEEVRSYIDGMLRENGAGFQQKLTDAGIDVDRDFIEPLGVMMSQAVNTNFNQIKTFANALSAMGAEAVNQGFELFIPTMDGHLIPIGDMEYWISKDPGDKRQQKWTLPDGETASIVQVQHMNKRWDSRAGRDIPDLSNVGNSIRIFKAATQMAVMLTHANDNTNMQRAIYNMHEAKLGKRKADKNDAMDESSLPYGNTSLHIFDGLLVTPKEAEEYAEMLNNVFRDMNTDPNKSHMHALYTALSFELDSNGEKILDENFENHPVIKKGQGDMSDTQWNKLRNHYRYRRRLKPEAREESLEDGGPSSWDPKYNKAVTSKGRVIREAQAFDWKTPDKTVKGKKVRGTQWYFNKYFKGEGAFYDAKQQFARNKQHYKQFFYSTDTLDNQIKNYKGNANLDAMVWKSK